MPLCYEIACLNLLLDSPVHRVRPVEAELVDLENQALGVLSVTPEFKEKLDREGFLVCQDYPALWVLLDLKATEEFLVTWVLQEWEWKVPWDQPVLMALQVPQEQASQVHRDCVDHLENTAEEDFQADLVPLGLLDTVSFVKHLRCRPTEEDRRKARSQRNEPITAKIVTIASSSSLLVILVTILFLTFIFHLCTSHHYSSLCSLVPYTLTKGYMKYRANVITILKSTHFLTT